MAQVNVPLEEFQRRNQDYKPSHAGERLVLKGVVNAGVFAFPGYRLLSIGDPTGGAMLQVGEADSRLDGYRPGDELQVEGVVSFFAGAVTLVPEHIRLVSRRSPPAPVELKIQDLQGPQHLGRLVRTEGRVVQRGENTAGAFLDLAAGSGTYRLFVPHSAAQPVRGLTAFSPGDVVQATGVAHQYYPHPPYNRYFELLVVDPSDIVLTSRSWFVPVLVVILSLGAVGFVGFFLWTRERRLRLQRQRLRRTYQLGEEILGASSAEAILERISDALPRILGVTRVHLYLYNRTARTLDAVAGEGGEPASISLSAPPGGTGAGAVACFHYRTLLVIPDIERSPFPMSAPGDGKTPRSLLFVPMQAQGEVVGVLELDQEDRVRDFSTDEQELAQHLSNQIGVALRLLDQRSVQEQLFRTEKLAAVGRLISGVVNELQTPLASISDLAVRALDRSHASAERELGAIAAEARKAADMVARLVSFAAAEQVEARPVSINGLLRNLIEFREGDWKASGIKARDLTLREPLFVLGSQGQLEQLFLNLLVHAEQSLADAPQKVITVRTSVLARRVLVEIAFSAPAELRKTEEMAAVLGLTRSLIAGHGGEVRLIDKSNSDPRFEVELPAAAKERVTAAAAAASSNGHAAESGRHLTVLVIEPDENAQRQLLAQLSAYGCRVVPVDNSDTGLELAHRMRFDAAFCSLHAPGLNWVELSERMHSRVGGFILLSDGYDAELANDFEGEGRFVLARPVQEADLERVMGLLEQSSSVIVMKNGVA